MKKEYRNIALWLSSMLMLLFMACGGSESESGDNIPPKEHQLQINIFTPEHPLVTRAGDPVLVNSNADENVNSMDVWVFVSEVTTTTIPADEVKFKVGKVVGHLSLDIADPKSFEGGNYQMSVNEDFVNELPNVNVYVTANVKPSNTGITLTANSPESAFGDATLSGGYFGLKPSLTTQVPSEGLPMSGVLKDQKINDDNTPLLKVKDHVTVVRAVSKVRFIFSRTNTGDNEKLQITRITLDNEVIPKKEYLFLNAPYSTNSFNIEKSLEPVWEPETLLEPLKDCDNIPVSTYPAKYAYDSQLKGQEYENLIDQGLKQETPDIAEVGRFYLRETDQPVAGYIYYKIGNGEEKSVRFSMADEKGFTRNHTWIVYGYFAGKELLKIYSIDTTDWSTSSADHPVFNW